MTACPGCMINLIAQHPILGVEVRVQILLLRILFRTDFGNISLVMFLNWNGLFQLTPSINEMFLCSYHIVEKESMPTWHPQARG